MVRDGSVLLEAVVHLWFGEISEHVVDNYNHVFM